MDSRYSMQALLTVSLNALLSKGLDLLFLLPLLFVVVKYMVAGVFGACGVPARISLLTSDVVMFFLLSLLVFSALNGHLGLPDLSSVAAPFRELTEAIRCAGLY